MGRVFCLLIVIMFFVNGCAGLSSLKERFFYKKRPEPQAPVPDSEIKPDTKVLPNEEPTTLKKPKPSPKSTPEKDEKPKKDEKKRKRRLKYVLRFDALSSYEKEGKVGKGSFF